jgi:hypothetical protein
MRVIINPKYRKFESFVNDLPKNFESSGESIYKGRNEIKIFECNGVKLNVKSFKIPHFINKIAYAWLRGSKAKHSFQYAIKMISLGVDTPEPIACVEILKNGLFDRSYYVSIHHEYDFTFWKIPRLTISRKKELLINFTQFTFNKLHRNRVFHPDYSPGNILIKDRKPDFEFSIVDVNRIRFKKVSYKKGLKNFSHLWAEDFDMDIIAREYARLNGKNEDLASKQLIEMEKKHQEKVKRKYRLKEKLKRKNK